MLLKSTSICFGILCSVALVLPAAASSENPACDIPQDLQHELHAKYMQSKLVELSDLDEHDRDLFDKQHDGACPGVVKVDFYGDRRPTLAMILIAQAAGNKKAELVVAHKIGETWKTTLLDTADASIPVVWSENPGDYHDVYGKKTIRATRPVIVFCGYESWAILYAWKNDRVEKIWLSD